MGESSPVCEVHGCPVAPRPVRVVYGLRRGLKQSPAYLAARRDRFPHCGDWSNGGCRLQGAQVREVPVCPECVAARDAYLGALHPTWLASHQPDSI